MRESIEKNNGSRYTEIEMSRRDFLRKAGVAALGAAAVGTGFATANAAEQLTVNGLPAAMFGATGLKVTKISFGGILITEPPVLLRAIEQGINLIHTAPGYQNGRSIEAFGKVMKTHRDRVVLALKARPEDLDESLKVLNTDYVDILVPPMHSVGAVQDDRVPENFEKAKKAGKCGFMGFACHSRMADVLNRARELGWYQATLMGYGKANDPEFLTAARKATEAGIGIMTMKGLPKRASEGLTSEEMKTVSSLCSSMVNQQYAHSVLASMGSFQAVDSYRQILETKLSYHNPGLEQRYWAEQQGEYCSNCGACSGVCPQGPALQRTLRYRMYYKDYGMKDYARSKYAALGLGANPVAELDCASCESVCPRGLPLSEMVREAQTLLA